MKNKVPYKNYGQFSNAVLCKFLGTEILPYIFHFKMEKNTASLPNATVVHGICNFNNCNLEHLNHLLI